MTARRAFHACLLSLALTLLPGCGGGGSDTSGAEAPGGVTGPGGAVGQAGDFGTLQFSGTGASISGVTFQARTKLAISGAGYTTTSWYGIDLRGPVVYPFVVLVLIQDSTGAVIGVDVNYMTSEQAAGGEWANLSLGPGDATATATSVTFNNVVAPSYGPQPSTSLTLNGTLRF